MKAGGVKTGIGQNPALGTGSFLFEPAFASRRVGLGQGGVVSTFWRSRETLLGFSTGCVLCPVIG